MGQKGGHKTTSLTPTCSHWGNYLVEHQGDELIAVHPYEIDKEPTAIRENMLSALDPHVRIAQPMVRESYLADPENSKKHLRGVDRYVPVSWEQALKIAAEALTRVKRNYGNKAIYGGSYGWASAGRFHHAQSQMHRFLNGFGGYTNSINTYSLAAAEVVLPHVLGIPAFEILFQAPTSEDIAKHTKTMMLFGGAPMKNNQINVGSLYAHSAKEQLQDIKSAGVEVINVSPIRNDTADFLDAQWVPVRPCSDVALMLGMAHTLYSEGLHDTGFLNKYCTGFDRFLPYLLGATDGCTKDAKWAEEKCEVPENTIKKLARKLASGRSVLGISWSLQRQEHGEQTYWMVTTLAAMLGHIGLPGGGVAYGYGCIHNMGFSGRRYAPFSVGSLPQGENKVSDFIPVARVTEMLESPGDEIDYNGQKIIFPDIQLIYWAGGNPFHHHQGLNRMRKAWCKPDTVIINEAFWTGSARHADIIFPTTTTMERNDIGGDSDDTSMSPMRQVAKPFKQSRSDYEVFSGLSERLDFAESFTEGRSEREWIETIYDITRSRAHQHNVSLPTFEDFWQGQQISYADQIPDATFPLEKFRQDPIENALNTPSGKIEIFSETIEKFHYEDCIGHPAWYDKDEWLGGDRQSLYPLHLISNQPKGKLHSQYDHGRTSRANKISGREPVRLNPQDAAARNIKNNDIVRLFNDRGACLAAAVLSDDIRPGVIELATGAWYWPQNPCDSMTLEVHGNPNVLTRDRGTSSLAQGPSAHSCLVQVELFGVPGFFPRNRTHLAVALAIQGFPGGGYFTEQACTPQYGASFALNRALSRSI